MKLEATNGFLVIRSSDDDNEEPVLYSIALHTVHANTLESSPLERGDGPFTETQRHPVDHSGNEVGLPNLLSSF